MVLDRFMLGMKWIQMKRSETSANFVSIGELEFGACTQAEVHRAPREENVVIEKQLEHGPGGFIESRAAAPSKPSG
jgi:hypothetical protein